MTEATSLTGRLLVATPALADPNFDRAVVLVLDHDAEGSLGVVINRPTPVGVGDILEPWAAFAGEPGVVFQGGPVSLDAALGVAVVPASYGGADDAYGGAAAVGGDGTEAAPGPEADGIPEEGDELEEGDEEDSGDGPLGWRRVHGAIGVVDLEAPPELLAAELGSLRIFAGYAGWGPGQLESELSDGAWYVVESEPGDVSSPAPEGLWRSVLRRQRSEIAVVATYPDDASLN